jgi:transcriptional regulator with XRE-family HTH domain
MLLPRLKAYRELKGETQVSLAEKAGVGPVSIVRAETGHSVWPSSAKKIAEALGLEIVDLMDPESIPSYMRSEAGATTRVVRDADLRWRVLEESLSVVQEDPKLVSDFLKKNLSEEEVNRLGELLLDKGAA